MSNPEPLTSLQIWFANTHLYITQANHVAVIDVLIGEKLLLHVDSVDGGAFVPDPGHVELPPRFASVQRIRESAELSGTRRSQSEDQSIFEDMD